MFDVEHVCLCLAKAKALPQQPALQHDTGARKGSDMLNGEYRRFGSGTKGK